MTTYSRNSFYMKAFAALLLSSAAFVSKSFAQFTELTGIAGYTCAETFTTTDAYEVRISDGFTYGGSLTHGNGDLSRSLMDTIEALGGRIKPLVSIHVWTC